MNTIVLYGAEKDDAVSRVLLAALRGLHAGVLHLTAKTVALLPPDVPAPAVLLVDDGCAHTPQLAECVLLFKGRCAGHLPEKLPPACAAVLAAQDEAAAAPVRAARIPTVTCGLSPKDTVTFSSRAPGSAVISLLRALHGADGREIEPRELPVALSTPRDDYPLLACVAALWLAGCKLPENGLRI